MFTFSYFHIAFLAIFLLVLKKQWLYQKSYLSESYTTPLKAKDFWDSGCGSPVSHNLGAMWAGTTAGLEQLGTQTGPQGAGVQSGLATGQNATWDAGLAGRWQWGWGGPLDQETRWLAALMSCWMQSLKRPLMNLTRWRSFSIVFFLWLIDIISTWFYSEYCIARVWLVSQNYYSNKGMGWDGPLLAPVGCC